MNVACFQSTMSALLLRWESRSYEICNLSYVLSGHGFCLSSSALQCGIILVEIFLHRLATIAVDSMIALQRQGDDICSSRYVTSSLSWALPVGCCCNTRSVALIVAPNEAIRAICVFCSFESCGEQTQALGSKWMCLLAACEVPPRSPGGNICLSSPVFSLWGVCL